MEMFALFFGAAETPGSAASHRCLALSLVIQEGKVALSGAGERTLTNPSYLKVQGHQRFIKASLFSIASIWKSTIVLEEITCKKTPKHLFKQTQKKPAVVI